MTDIASLAPPVEILLIEDNEGDADLTAEALASASRHSTLHVMKSGDAALDFLRGDDLRPDLILLDLNLPGTDGRDVLRALKSDPRLHAIPVVVFSASNDPAVIASAYALGASSYIVKPGTYADYQRIMKILDLYWFSVVVRTKVWP